MTTKLKLSFLPSFPTGKENEMFQTHINITFFRETSREVGDNKPSWRAEDDIEEHNDNPGLRSSAY
jgi:hypothetical protein